MPLLTTSQLSKMTPEEVQALLRKCRIEHISVPKKDFKTQAKELINRGITKAAVKTLSTNEVVEKLKDAITISIGKSFLKKLLDVAGIPQEDKMETSDILAAYILAAKTPEGTVLTKEQTDFLAKSESMIDSIDAIVFFLSSSKNCTMESVPSALIKEFVKQHEQYKAGQDMYDDYSKALEQTIYLATRLIKLFQAREDINDVKAVLESCDQEEREEFMRRMCAFKIEEVIMIKEIDEIIPTVNIALVDHNVLASLSAFLSAMITMLCGKMDRLIVPDAQIIPLSVKIQVYRDKLAEITARLERV